MRRGLLTIGVLVIAGCRGASGVAGSSPLGEALYAQHGCGVCHGRNGEGHGPGADAVPQDFRRRRDPLAEGGRDGVAKLIGAGRGRMPAFRHLSDADRRQLAAFVLYLSQQPEWE